VTGAGSAGIVIDVEVVSTHSTGRCGRASGAVGVYSITVLASAGRVEVIPGLAGKGSGGVETGHPGWVVGGAVGA
jgi:hypothetical protein